MIQDLLAGNVAWAAGRHADRDFFPHRAAPRKADYLWIGCADSRLSAQELTGQDPGAILVHANLGNLALAHDMSLLASLQFSLETLKVRHIVVCGHYGCGAMQAALSDARTGLADHWLSPLRALAWRHAQDLEAIIDLDTRANRLCELNVAAQLANLAANHLVHDAWRRGQALSLHGWVHSAADGLLRDLETSISGPRQAMALVGGPVDQTTRRRSRRAAL